MVIGKDGWLFTDEEFKPAPSGQQLEDNWALVRGVQRELNRRGVKLVLAVIPAKARLYPEHIGREQPAALHDSLYQDFLARARAAGTASGGWAQPDPAPIGYAVLNVSRERVESGTACDVGLYVHDELVGNLQPGASLALNLQPGAVDVRLAPNGPGDACRNGMTILAGQTLTLRAGEIRNLRIALGAGGLYLAPVADGY
ncbi:hypothetical protein Z046_00225 [Pseudomonas aeruginosa VRFPA09]|nr:hypothetical protein Z046_00225 [Pseudomonas aeruginosa VRFPA09]